MNFFGNNTEKYILKEKEVKKIDKDGNENFVPISYQRFMMSLSSNLANNLAGGVQKIKCKDHNCFLKYRSVKGNLINYECLSCNNNYSNEIDEVLRKRFMNTFKFYRNDINFLIMILISLSFC